MDETTAVDVPGVAAFMPSVCAFNAQPLPTPLQRALAILSAVLDDAHPIQEEFEPYDPKMIELDPSGGVSRTLDNAEVRANIIKWVEAIQNEVDSLVEKTAIERKSPAEALQFLKDHPLAQIYPGKGVFVEKRTGKLKARGVICGNYDKMEQRLPTQNKWTQRQSGLS